VRQRQPSNRSVASDVVRFLDHLLRHVSGLLTIIWDGSPIHRSKVIKGYLVNGAAGRIHLERAWLRPRPQS
jgi:hypothetical protein